MKTLSDWIVVDQYFATRIIEGGDVNNIADRVAFIEKTPRIRIRHYGMGAAERDDLNWASGYKGDDGFDLESRQWCDRMLSALGYIIPNNTAIVGWQFRYRHDVQEWSEWQAVNHAVYHAIGDLNSDLYQRRELFAPPDY